MARHNGTWISIYSTCPSDSWRVMESLKSHFNDNQYVVFTFKEHDYDRNNDVEFLSHVLHLANQFLDIKHTQKKPIVVCDVPLAFIKKKMENFKCPFLALNIDELFSNRRITSNVRHNKFIFFPNFASKKEYESMQLSSTNSCTTGTTDMCIEEAKRFIEELLAGDFELPEYPEFHSLVPDANK